MRRHASRSVPRFFLLAACLALPGCRSVAPSRAGIPAPGAAGLESAQEAPSQEAASGRADGASSSDVQAATAVAAHGGKMMRHRRMGGRMMASMNGMSGCVAMRRTGMAGMGGSAEPAAGGEAGAEKAAPAPECPAPTAELAAAGRKVFTGSGNCYTCHGMDAKGTPLAPNLVAHKWLNIDGSYAAIAKLVHTGVAQPKQHPAPMPPMGGGTLSAAEVCAVSAYVYLLSHKT